MSERSELRENGALFGAQRRTAHQRYSNVSPLDDVNDVRVR